MATITEVLDEAQAALDRISLLRQEPVGRLMGPWLDRQEEFLRKYLQVLPERPDAKSIGGSYMWEVVLERVAEVDRMVSLDSTNQWVWWLARGSGVERDYEELDFQIRAARHRVTDRRGLRPEPKDSEVASKPYAWYLRTLQRVNDELLPALEDAAEHALGVIAKLEAAVRQAREPIDANRIQELQAEIAAVSDRLTDESSVAELLDALHQQRIEQVLLVSDELLPATRRYEERRQEILDLWLAPVDVDDARPSEA